MQAMKQYGSLLLLLALDLHVSGMDG